MRGKGSWLTEDTSLGEMELTVFYPERTVRGVFYITRIQTLCWACLVSVNGNFCGCSKYHSFPDPLASYIPLRSLHKRQLRVVAAFPLDPFTACVDW